MGTLTTIDAWILRQFQKFSDFVQYMCGASCFTLARICLGIFSAMSFCSIFFFLQLMLHGGGGLFLAFQMATTTRMYMILETCIILYEMKNTGGMLLKNRAEIELQVLRRGLIIVTVVFTLLLILGASTETPTAKTASDIYKMMYLRNGVRIFYCSSILITSGMFFCSCTPKPPGTSKVKKLVESIREILSPQPNLAGA